MELEALTEPMQLKVTQEWDGNTFVLRLQFDDARQVSRDFKTLVVNKTQITFSDGTVFNLMLAGDRPVPTTNEAGAASVNYAGQETHPAFADTKARFGLSVDDVDPMPTGVNAGDVLK